jgi:glycosyltransferase involved in cell wall biosynthesis
VAAAPVFYQAPLYRLLAADPRVEFSTLFASNAGVRAYNDTEFGGQSVVWGKDLTEGYPARFAAAAGANDIFGGFFALRDGDIFREVLRGPYDVIWVHGYSYLSLWLAILAAKLSGKHLMIREEQTLLDRRASYRALPRMLVLRTIFARSWGLFIGKENRRFFRHYGIPADRLYWVPYTADNEKLLGLAAELVGQRERLRAVFGIPPDSGPVLLFVGKLMSKKQPLTLLEAFSRVRGRHRCSLLFAGDGALGPAIQARVASESIPDVYLAGFLNRERVAEAFAIADVFVLPSAFQETWGIVVNEAMNFSLPVIVTDRVGSSTDLVKDEQNGYIVPHDRVDVLEDRIERLVVDAGLRRRFGQRSLEIVSNWNDRQALEGVVAACRAATGIARAAERV